jgi:hypothetical protein
MPHALLPILSLLALVNGFSEQAISVVTVAMGS